MWSAHEVVLETIGSLIRGVCKASSQGVLRGSRCPSHCSETCPPASEQNESQCIWLIVSSNHTSYTNKINHCRSRQTNQVCLRSPQVISLGREDRQGGKGKKRKERYRDIGNKDETSSHPNSCSLSPYKCSNHHSIPCLSDVGSRVLGVAVGEKFGGNSVIESEEVPSLFLEHRPHVPRDLSAHQDQDLQNV